MRVFCQLTLSVVTVLFGSGEITRGENWVRGGTPARQGGSALTPPNEKVTCAHLELGAQS